jgi:hypothetical protein
MKKGLGGFGGFSNPPTNQDIDKLKEILKRPDVKGGHISRWNEESEEVELIVGSFIEL